MKYFSTFSGIGGFEIGIQRAFDKQLAEIEQDRQGWDRTTDEMEHDVLPTGCSDQTVHVMSSNLRKQGVILPNIRRTFVETIKVDDLNKLIREKFGDL